VGQKWGYNCTLSDVFRGFSDTRCRNFTLNNRAKTRIKQLIGGQPLAIPLANTLYFTKKTGLNALP
jgi:hypothetical protein